MTDDAPAPSASLILLRDGVEGLEVLLLARPAAARAFAGALVFPGGKLAADDHDPALIGLCRGAEQLSDDERVHRIAAVRETFEECGLLLARAGDGDDLIDADRALALAAYRPALDRGTIGIAEFCRSEQLALALDGLTSFARWITPPSRPPCFDTCFYLAVAPPGQQAEHDGDEVLDSLWLTPAEALARAEEGELKLVFPTWMNLLRLAGATRVAEALDQAGRVAIVPICPVIEPHPEGRIVHLPERSGYGARRVLVRHTGGPIVLLD